MKANIVEIAANPQNLLNAQIFLTISQFSSLLKCMNVCSIYYLFDVFLNLNHVIYTSVFHIFRASLKLFHHFRPLLVKPNQFNKNPKNIRMFIVQNFYELS